MLPGLSMSVLILVSPRHDMGVDMRSQSDPSYYNRALPLAASQFKIKIYVLLELVYREQGP